MHSHDHVDFPVFAEQYESFVKFTQDQIMRRYGARPASCEYSNSRVIRDCVNLLYGLILNDLCLFQTSPELASTRPQLPLTIWLLFYFYLVSLFNPTISNCLGAMICSFFKRKSWFLTSQILLLAKSWNLKVCLKPTVFPPSIVDILFLEFVI